MAYKLQNIRISLHLKDVFGDLRMLPAIKCHTDVGRRAMIVAVVRLTPIIITDDNWPTTKCECRRSTELITHNNCHLRRTRGF